MKNKLQQMLSAIAKNTVYLKFHNLFGNCTKHNVGGKFKKDNSHQDLIDITNLKTELFCDLKVDSNKLKDIVGDNLDIVYTPKSRKEYKSVKYFEIVFTNPKDEFDEIMNYVESLTNDKYFEKYLKMDYIIRADFICVEFIHCRPIWIEFSSILESKN